MQNRYTADLGDFGKYGLLKALCQSHGEDEERNLRLGVVWYLLPHRQVILFSAAINLMKRFESVHSTS